MKDDDLSVFDCAFKAERAAAPIHYMGHVKMMGAVHRLFRRNSQDIPCSTDATVEEIMHAYMESCKLGFKAIAIYRDGSKHTQPA